ncbi:MAG: hypothetical protein EBR02_00800 [Alphaproteobacteria bacterium]|jgi:hypothetical protein|nr:hypothetical protein [Alphaproteobacteria bacterium]
MSIERKYKDPDEVISFGVDWSEYLGAETVTSSDWTVASGVTKVGQTLVGKQANVTISGGTLGTVNRITNRITTSAGETVDQSIDIEIIVK